MRHGPHNPATWNHQRRLQNTRHTWRECSWLAGPRAFRLIMARYDIAPTKTNLLRLRREHSFAHEGHQLLDQKKDILTAELLALVDRARTAERDMDRALAAAFHSLRNAIVQMGRNSVAQTAAAILLPTHISVSRRRVMGLTLPIVEISVGELSPSFRPGDTSFWVDETTIGFREVLRVLGMFVETRASLSVLAQEVKKTIRRVNALEKIALPDYQETLKYIGDTLEEMERQTFFTMKLVKNRLIRRRTESGR